MEEGRSGKCVKKNLERILNAGIEMVQTSKAYRRKKKKETRGVKKRVTTLQMHALAREKLIYFMQSMFIIVLFHVN